MFVRRRRPLARAAMVGGAAYYAGKKGQQASDRESEQEYRLQQLEAQQTQPQQLKEQGILTQEEFDAQKSKLLGLS
jgi:hypothetical protein